MSPPSLYHLAYLTHGGKRYLIARQAEWLPLIGSVLLSPQSGVTAQAAEVMANAPQHVCAHDTRSAKGKGELNSTTM